MNPFLSCTMFLTALLGNPVFIVMVRTCGSLTAFLLQAEAGVIAIRKTAARIVMIFFIVLVFSIIGAKLQNYIQKKEFLEKKMTRD